MLFRAIFRNLEIKNVLTPNSFSRLAVSDGQKTFSARQQPFFGGGERGWRWARARYLLRAALNAHLACADQTIPSVRRSLQSKKETVLSSLFQCSFMTPYPELRENKSVTDSQHAIITSGCRTICQRACANKNIS